MIEDDHFDLVLDIDRAEDQCGFMMFGNEVGYPAGREFFNNHLELFVACHVAARDFKTGWDALRLATKEPPTDETMADIAAQIVKSGAKVRVGTYINGKLYHCRPDATVSTLSDASC